MHWLAPSELRIKPPLCDLFPRNGAIVSTIAESMKENGYDEAEPIVYWHGHCVVDGHTRREAAQSAGIEAAVIMRDFADEDAALEYAIRRQVDRRQLSDAEIMRLRRELDKRKKQGERTDLAPSDAKSNKSAEETADLLGTSPRKVEKARTIDDHATPETKAAVDAGDMSINAAYNLTQEERRYRDAVAGLGTLEKESFLGKVQAGNVTDDIDGLRAWQAVREEAAKADRWHPPAYAEADPTPRDDVIHVVVQIPDGAPPRALTGAVRQIAERLRGAGEVGLLKELADEIYDMAETMEATP